MQPLLGRQIAWGATECFQMRAEMRMVGVGWAAIDHDEIAGRGVAIVKYKAVAFVCGQGTISTSRASRRTPAKPSQISRSTGLSCVKLKPRGSPNRMCVIRSGEIGRVVMGSANIRPGGRKKGL